MQAANQLPALGVSFPGNGARIDHAQVGVLLVARLAVAVRLQGFLDVLRFILVDFAAEGYQPACGFAVHGNPIVPLAVSKWPHCTLTRRASEGPAWRVRLSLAGASGWCGAEARGRKRGNLD